MLRYCARGGEEKIQINETKLEPPVANELYNEMKMYSNLVFFHKEGENWGEEE